jgi:hypothetical protein
MNGYSTVLEFDGCGDMEGRAMPVRTAALSISDPIIARFGVREFRLRYRPSPWPSRGERAL